MKITHGLLTGQVLQRDGQDRGGARIEGATKSKGAVEARVLGKRGVLRGLDWRAVGEADGRRFTAELGRIPSGGPYTVELRSGKETLAVEEVFVGDVWFLAGQSNMQGVGNLNEALKPHPLVRAFYMRDEWDIAAEPLHVLGEAVDPVHRGQGGNAGDVEVPVFSRAQAAKERRTVVKGTCPGLGFAGELLKRTGVPQGLVLCAHGGTTMQQWSPDLKDRGGKSLYGAMLRRFQKLGQPVRGIAWYQGESDANEEAIKVYTQRMQELVAAVRADFNQPNLPWMVVQIGRVIMTSWNPGPWNSIQEQQRRLPETISNLEVVPTIDYDLDDGIHISGNGENLLGVRLARMADRLALGNLKEKGSLRYDSMELYQPKGPHDPIANAIVVKFRNVVGGLRSAGRPTGFSLHDQNGTSHPAIFNTRLNGDSVILECTILNAALEAFQVKYGHGLDPVCNITDGRGMGLPVFGPELVSIGGSTPFITDWTVQGPQEVKGGLRRATPAADPTALDVWREPHDAAPFLVMPQDVHSPQPGIFYLRSMVRAWAVIDLILAIGSDSPFKTWLNGKQVGLEPDAANPCTPDQFKYPVKLRAGENSLLVAFDGRSGQGWGICARFLPVDRNQPIPEGTLEL